MMFCPKCGSIMMPNRNKKLKCSSCSYTNKKKEKVVMMEKTEVSSRKIEVIDKSINTNPKTQIECPKCANKEAFYWTIQTRAGDEAPTRFFECVKCHHRWREYD